MTENTQYLYRHFDKDNKLLYIGVSINALTRLSQHKSASGWFDEIASVKIEKFPDRESVLDAEKLAVIKEKPIHNIRHNKNIKDVDILKDAGQSRRLLLGQLVSFNPIYTLPNAAKTLDMSTLKLKMLIKQKKIGCVHDGTRNCGKHGERPVLKITGWQMIDYVEQVQLSPINP